MLNKLALMGGVIFLPWRFEGLPQRDWKSRPEASAGPRARPCTLPGLLRRMAREERASGGMELAIGAFALFGVAWAAFDLYSLTQANAASERIAATMADYVSREPAPDGDEMTALGKFLHQRELGEKSAALIFVISLVHRPAGKDAKAVVDWDYDKIRFGDKEETDDLVDECRKRAKAGWRAPVPGKDAGTLNLELKPHNVVVVVEVCASLLREGRLSELATGPVYRFHALAYRAAQGTPAAPTYSSASGESRSLGIYAASGDRDESPSGRAMKRAARAPGGAAVLGEAA